MPLPSFFSDFANAFAANVKTITRVTLSNSALAEWIGRILEDHKASALIQQRKPGSCPRTLRQPVKNGPETKTPGSKPLVKTILITNP